MNTRRTRLRKDAFPMPSILPAPFTAASLPQLWNPIMPASSLLSTTTTRFIPIQPRYATQPTPTQIPGNSHSEPIVAPAPGYSTFACSSVPGIVPSSTFQWVLVPQQPLLVLNTSSVELDSRRNEGINKNKPETVVIPAKKTKNARRTLYNVLNWIRKVNGNQLPEEVVQLLHPMFLTEPEPQGKSSVLVDESADEIKEEIKSEHSYSAPGSPTQSVEDSYLQFSSAANLGQENELSSVSHNCPYCDQGFDSMVELSKHSLVHCSLPLSRVRGKSVPLGSTKKCLRNVTTGIKMGPKGRVGGRADYHTHPCPKCTEEFTNQEKLWQHIRKNHPGHRMFKCDICEKGFHTPGELMKHRHRHTSEKREPKYTPCPQCNEKFTNQANLLKHVHENHPDHRMFKCDICEQGFHASSGLWVHRRAHHATEKQELKCTFCEKTFGLSYYLKRHIRRVHNKCKKFKCPHCPYACESSSLLSQHTDVHFGRNLKKCPHCGCLRPKNNIKKHIEQVHLGKRHKCNLCGGVIRQAAMRAHMLLKHPDVRNPILSDCSTVIFVEPSHGQQRKRLTPSKKLDTGNLEMRNRSESQTNPMIPPPSEPATTEDGTTDIILPNGKKVVVRYKVVDKIENHSPFPFRKRTGTRNTKYPYPDGHIARQNGKIVLKCVLCNNHPIQSKEWSLHMAKHERDPNYRITPRRSVQRLVDSANYSHQHTTKQCDVDSSVSNKCHPTSISEQPSESGLESECQPRSVKASTGESSCPIPDLNQEEVTTAGCTESAHPIEGFVSKEAVKRKKSIMMFKCPYETCTEPTGEWVPWANLKEHLASSHPEETGSGNGKQIRLNSSKPKPGEQPSQTTTGSDYTGSGNRKRIRLNYSKPKTDKQPKPKEKVPRSAKIPCPQCEKVVRADYMPVHIKYVHNKLQSVCHQCGKVVAASYMVTHLRYVHNELQSTPLGCKICNKTFQHKLYLDNHLKTVNHRKLAADINEKWAWSSQRSLRTDKPKPKEKVPRNGKIPCPQCGKLVSARNMWSHLNYVHNKLQSVCDQCGKVVGRVNMLRHLRYVHNEVQSTPLECKICNKTFQHKLYLDNHLKTINHLKLAAEKNPVEDAACMPEAAAASESHASD